MTKNCGCPVLRHSSFVIRHLSMQHFTSTPPASLPPAPARIGLMAGWGRYPLLVAEALRRQGSEVYCLGAVGHADPKLAEICRNFQWSGLARFGAAIRYFKRHAVTDVIMAGKIHKVLLFQPWMILRNMPDLRTYRMFIPHFLTRSKDCKDDTLLGAIVQEFAREGMRFGRPTDYAAELLVSKGQLTRRGPSAWQWKDIHFGWKLAKEMGRLDVGQSVAVKDQAVLAIEAVEGTDECIRRAGVLCRAGGFTVVKVAKPQQDMRYDVPTIGMRTVENIASSGGRVLAIEASRTILLDGPEVIDFADRHGLVIVAID
ncbi:MAG: UDP-2,3-diacylglucosamine diphosphatase LpxI [Planctomycetota bacterium]